MLYLELVSDLITANFCEVTRDVQIFGIETNWFGPIFQYAGLQIRESKHVYEIAVFQKHVKTFVLNQTVQIESISFPYFVKTCLFYIDLYAKTLHNKLVQ